MSRSKRAALPVLIMLALASLACSLFTGKQVTPSPVDETAVATQDLSLQEATVASGGKGTTGSLIDLSQGLNTLVSYQVVFNADVSSKDNAGKGTQENLQVTQDKINADQSQHTIVNMSGALGLMNVVSPQIEVYQVAGMSYMIREMTPGQSSCSSYPAGQMPFQAMLITPSDIIGQIHDAKLVKKGETVNNVIADHYRFDQSNLTGSKLSNAKGDVWIALDGNYVARLTGTAVGIDMLLLSDLNANFTYNYAVGHVGKVANIEVPKECRGKQPANVPMFSNVTYQGVISGSLFKLLFSKDHRETTISLLES